MPSIIVFPFSLYGDNVDMTFVGPFATAEQAQAYLDSDPEKQQWNIDPIVVPLYPPACEDEEHG